MRSQSRLIVEGRVHLSLWGGGRGEPRAADALVVGPGTYRGRVGERAVRDELVVDFWRGHMHEANEDEPSAARHTGALVEQLAAVRRQVAAPAPGQREPAHSVAPPARGSCRPQAAARVAGRAQGVEAEAAALKLTRVREEDGEGEEVAIAVWRQPVLRALLVPDHEQVSHLQLAELKAIVQRQRRQHDSRDERLDRAVERRRRLALDRNVGGRVVLVPPRRPAVCRRVLERQRDERSGLVRLKQAKDVHRPQTGARKGAGGVVRQPERTVRREERPVPRRQRVHVVAAHIHDCVFAQSS
mmetsp:Transcript_42110/g.135802  ORF Transcript_42110/g.135802 Transcript_42110/m.135802 type:complete len:300 (+) Transcript_42110:30-929(+)